MKMITKKVSLTITVEMNDIELALSQCEWDTIGISGGCIRAFNDDNGRHCFLYDRVLEEINEDLAEWVETIDIEVDDE